MTSSTASTGDRGLLETRFSMGAAAVAAVAGLLALAFGWLGYTDGVLPVIGFQLDILTGIVGLLFGFAIAMVAAVAAVYMEPGFDE
ncbi:hypothetical protein SAMN04489841_1196 [Natrinema salaciae]|uniref:Uncharacterized protein n=2 Tax=Natrinema salaciae TaxID=1186196 RepID=A0A1H9CYK0_9EURY|nr:hypothetical protein SAMN04489841_1196 [Natrinema salaciae]